jgi:hypothetical protein
MDKVMQVTIAAFLAMVDSAQHFLRAVAAYLEVAKRERSEGMWL